MLLYPFPPDGPPQPGCAAFMCCVTEGWAVISHMSQLPARETVPPLDSPVRPQTPLEGRPSPIIEDAIDEAATAALPNMFGAVDTNNRLLFPERRRRSKWPIVGKCTY